ncbi:CBS domain-containing protein [Ideonella sp.]|uniref:CBS domain-containing protein n=1 Tax=Ideonella sp. TaxID=1929293 RepID=UPI0035B0F487
MNIDQICKRPIVSIDATATLRQAATLMREQHVGALVVRATGGERPVAVGIVTDRDLAIEVLARDLAPADVSVASIASRKLLAVRGSAGVTEAIAVMADHGVRRLLVTDDEGQLTGFVSADDILEALANDLHGLAVALRVGMAREGVERPAVPVPHPRPVFLPHGTPGML